MHYELSVMRSSCPNTNRQFKEYSVILTVSEGTNKTGYF